MNKLQELLAKFKASRKRMKLMRAIQNDPIDVSVLSTYVWYACRSPIPRDDKIALHVAIGDRVQHLSTEFKTDIDKSISITLSIFGASKAPSNFSNLKMEVESRISKTQVQGMTIEFRDVLSYENISLTTGNFSHDKDFIEDLIRVIAGSMIYTLKTYIREDI